jgi:hypothetical protein
MDAVKAVTALVISGGLLVGASPAFAISASTTGAYATASGADIALKDTKADGQSVKAIWYRKGASNPIDLINSSGYNSTVTYTTGGTVVLLKACRIGRFSPDNCSGWQS